MDDFFTCRKNQINQCNFDFPTTDYLTKAKLNITSARRGVVLSCKDNLYQSHIKKAQNKGSRPPLDRFYPLLFPVDQQKSRPEDLRGTLVSNLNAESVGLWRRKIAVTYRTSISRSRVIEKIL